MPDPHAATELKLYIDNDGPLYRQITTSILKNLAAKKARGVYRHDLAVKGFGYLVEAGAKKYAGTFGSGPWPWHKMFDVSTRKRVAEELTRDFEEAYAEGDYDGLLPKKYQKSAKSPASKKLVHASKKSGFDARVNARLTSPKASQSSRSSRSPVESPRVEILKSGDSKYFRPGQFGYVVGSTSRGGMHTLDRGDSMEGDLTYLVSKRPKSAGGGALWFSDDALLFTGPGGGTSKKDPKQIAREVEAVVGKVPSYRGR